jgi:hypothetical protein
VLRIFIVLKNPWSGLNQRPLSPVTSTLTTIPPRRLYFKKYDFLLLIRFEKIVLHFAVLLFIPVKFDEPYYASEKRVSVRSHANFLCTYLLRAIYITTSPS